MGLRGDFSTTKLAVQDSESAEQDDKSSTEEPEVKLGGPLSERDELVAEARRGRLSCVG
jgi:hypothetical protein